MSIEQNDGVLTKAPKPTDVKMFVGDGTLYEYATKEDIPVAYRFEGMTVQEWLLGAYKIYRLEGGTADGDYTEILTDTGEVNTASNLGGGEGVFVAKVVNDLQLKSLIAGTDIGLSSTATEITIAFTGTYLTDAPSDGSTYGRLNGAWSAIVSTGTVTSIGISGADGITVALSPVTTSGTIALSVNATTLRSHLNVEDGANVTDATNVLAAGAVMQTGNQTIAGTKIFSSFPETATAAPTADYHIPNKKYVDDEIKDIAGERRTVYLGALDVNSLGTAYNLLNAPGVGKYYNVFSVVTKITVTTQLDSNTQDLWFGPGGKDLCKLSQASLETATTAVYQSYMLDGSEMDILLPDNTAFTARLSAGNNPLSGSVTLHIALSYTIESL